MKYLICIVSLLFILATKVEAVYDPLSMPNNKYGIHILDPVEVEKAAKLVNSQGGDWGYVTVPIRGDDRDREKWENFFNQCRDLHLIPILRLATFGRGDSWVLPTEDEMLDFANFLNQMPWPIKNRYILVLNEINHSKEWGGYVDPEAYARMLKFTIEIFKSRNGEFFVMPAAMDMAAPTNEESIDGITYWLKVFKTEPELVQMIDGWNAHAYPNPGFVGKPSDKHAKSIVSYRYELNLLKRLGREKIPVFITETGWDQEKIAPEILKQYWQYAYNYIWTDDEVVAVTPFILAGGDGPFEPFSFLSKDNQPSKAYEALEEMPKVKGEPRLDQLGQATTKVLSEETNSNEITIKPLVDLDQLIQGVKDLLSSFVNNQPYMSIGDAKVNIEVADTPEKITLGLGGRSSMSNDQGMLFVFGLKGEPSFWMKDTLFPLDIVWMADNRVVDITEKIPVEPNPASPKNFYRPQQPVDNVLEVNAGWVEDNGVKVGDEVRIVK